MLLVISNSSFQIDGTLKAGYAQLVSFSYDKLDW